MIAPAPSRLVTLVWSGVGVLTALWYFSWLLRPDRAGVVALFALLIVADLFNGFHALSFWITSLRGRRARPFTALAGVRVDVLIPTVNEPVDVLGATIRAATAMHGADLRVHVLDDGRRPEIAELAMLSGAVYHTRPDRTGAKAGNLNAALRATADSHARYVCVFDADHVPAPEFLERTLGYFTDDQVALVQTPQVYGNADAGPITRGAAEQQAIFFGPICRGRDGFDATFCCGTNFVARRDALEAADGFPEESITEDIVLSMRLATDGWTLVYEPTPLAVGLGPADARSYLKQQHRWARGCLDLLLRRRSLWRGLSRVQRWQYLVATSYWLTGWTVLVYLALPVLRLLFDVPVIRDPDQEFAVHFLPYFLTTIVSLGRFTHGTYTLRGVALNWGSFAVHVKATIDVLTGRGGSFAVTSKRALAGVPWGALAPNVAAVAVLVGACVVGLLGEPGPASIANAAFATLGIALVGPLVVFSLVQARAVASQVKRPAPVAEPAPARGRFGRQATAPVPAEPSEVA